MDPNVHERLPLTGLFGLIGLVFAAIGAYGVLFPLRVHRVDVRLGAVGESREGPAPNASAPKRVRSKARGASIADAM